MGLVPRKIIKIKICLMLCVTVLVLRVMFFTARSFILFTVYIGRHFVYLVLFTFMFTF